jgi:hypothetical protein
MRNTRDSTGQLGESCVHADEKLMHVHVINFYWQKKEISMQKNHPRGTVIQRWPLAYSC